MPGAAERRTCPKRGRRGACSMFIKVAAGRVVSVARFNADCCVRAGWCRVLRPGVFSWRSWLTTELSDWRLTGRVSSRHGARSVAALGMGRNASFNYPLTSGFPA